MSLMLIMVILGGFIFILTGCNGKKEEPLDPNKDYVQISIPDNGSTLNHMMYVILDENIIKYKKVEREDEKKYKNVQGCSVNEDYYFEGASEGKTEIWVVDLFPGEIDAITRYEISVDSNLNAKIINSPKTEYKRIKCGTLNINVEESQINIDDNTIARNLNIWRWPNKVNIIGLKEGNTTMTIKEKDGTEKEYVVRVDRDLNVELEELSKKDFNKSMTGINLISISALYEGGSHPTYNVDDNDKKELEQIAKDIIKFNKTDSTQIDNSGLTIQMYVDCNDGQIYRFIMGKEKIYLEVEWINDTTRKMYEIIDDKFFNWVDNVIEKCEDTDYTIVKDWQKK